MHYFRCTHFLAIMCCLVGCGQEPSLETTLNSLKLTQHEKSLATIVPFGDSYEMKEGPWLVTVPTEDPTGRAKKFQKLITKPVTKETGSGSVFSVKQMELVANALNVNRDSVTQIDEGWLESRMFEIYVSKDQDSKMAVVIGLPQALF